MIKAFRDWLASATDDELHAKIRILAEEADTAYSREHRNLAQHLLRLAEEERLARKEADALNTPADRLLG